METTRSSVRDEYNGSVLRIFQGMSFGFEVLTELAGQPKGSVERTLGSMVRLFIVSLSHSAQTQRIPPASDLQYDVLNGGRGREFCGKCKKDTFKCPHKLDSLDVSSTQV